MNREGNQDSTGNLWRVSPSDTGNVWKMRCKNQGTQEQFKSHASLQHCCMEYNGWHKCEPRTWKATGEISVNNTLTITCYILFYIKCLDFCVHFSLTSQFDEWTFQVLNSHMWLVRIMLNMWVSTTHSQWFLVVYTLPVSVSTKITIYYSPSSRFLTSWLYHCFFSFMFAIRLQIRVLQG